MGLRHDIGGETIHGKWILNFDIKAPKNWGDEVVSIRNLTVDCEGMTEEELEALAIATWKVKYQAKLRDMPIEQVKALGGTIVKHGVIKVKAERVREMTLAEIVEKAKNDPTYKAELLKRLA